MSEFNMESEIFKEKLTEAVIQGKPFVIFRKPGDNKLFLVIQSEDGNFKFLLHSFDSKTEKSISGSELFSILVDEFDVDLNLELNVAPEFIPIKRPEYESLIRNTIQAIIEEEIPKIVISRIHSIQNAGINLLKSYKNLTEQNPNSLVYLWHNPGQETWMGATPELLLFQQGNWINTVALAGTKRPEDEWTDKEYEEQQYVTDFILDNFFDLKNVETKGPVTIGAGKLNHLKTYITAEIGQDFNRAKLLENIHPTPAVCGLPKKESFDFIIQNENYDRDFYTGYLGMETEDVKEYFVNLRCARFFNDKVWIYVGGGITAESIPEKEWLETELKSGTILNSLIDEL